MDLKLVASGEDLTGDEGCTRPLQRTKRSRREELVFRDALDKLDKEQYKKEQKIKK